MKCLYIILLLLVSCSSEVKIQDNYIEVVTNDSILLIEDLDTTSVQTIIKNNSSPDHTLQGLEQLETEFLNVIEQIEDSDTSNRRDLFYEFLTYSNKLDGAPAETYFYFTHDYVTNNALKFFEVLTIKDLSLINDWAEIASEEITLYQENQNNGDEKFDEISNQITEQTQFIKKNQTYLVDLYLENLNDHWQK